MPPIGGPVLVVISHYNVRSPDDVAGLLDQLDSIPAGWRFDVRVVVNVADAEVRLIPRSRQPVDVLYRPNVGYNIGAWDHGWRTPPAYPAYLFLQDECRLARPNWVAGFVARAAEPAVGLLGESLSPTWDAPWDEIQERFAGWMMPEHIVGGKPAERIDCYLDFFRRHAIEPGPRGDHLRSIVLFARREVLEAIDGFPVGENYGEAIAAEIGISKKVQALGLSVEEVGPGPFQYFRHPQWPAEHADVANPG